MHVNKYVGLGLWLIQGGSNLEEVTTFCRIIYKLVVCLTLHSDAPLFAVNV